MKPSTTAPSAGGRPCRPTTSYLGVRGHDLGVLGNPGRSTGDETFDAGTRQTAATGDETRLPTALGRLEHDPRQLQPRLEDVGEIEAGIDLLDDLGARARIGVEAAAERCQLGMVGVTADHAPVAGAHELLGGGAGVVVLVLPALAD